MQTAARLFVAARQNPRWPMYIRQVRQYLRTADETFDERKFGFAGIVEFLRACQKEGLLRLDRDRQGVLRVFPGPQFSRPAASTGGPAPEAIEDTLDAPQPSLVDSAIERAPSDEALVADIVVDDTGAGGGWRDGARTRQRGAAQACRPQADPVPRAIAGRNNRCAACAAGAHGRRGRLARHAHGRRRPVRRRRSLRSHPATG